VARSNVEKGRKKDSADSTWTPADCTTHTARQPAGEANPAYVSSGSYRVTWGAGGGGGRRVGGVVVVVVVVEIQSPHTSNEAEQEGGAGEASAIGMRCCRQAMGAHRPLSLLPRRGRGGGEGGIVMFIDSCLPMTR
jgi:hypothetical protein